MVVKHIDSVLLWALNFPYPSENVHKICLYFHSEICSMSEKQAGIYR